MRVVWLSLVLCFPAALAAQDGSIARAVGSITPTDLAQRLDIIAHDSMLGRDTPSRGLELTARYIADEFRRFGLTPAGAGGDYLQRYPLYTQKLNVATSAISVVGGPTWRFGTDAARLSGTGTRAGHAVVLWGRPETVEAMSELPLAQSVVLLIAPMTPQGGFEPWLRVLLQGAAAHDPEAIVLVSARSESAWRARVSREDRGRLVRGWEEEESTTAVEVRQQAIAAVLARHGVDLAAARAGGGGPLTARVLEQLRLSIRLDLDTVEAFTAPNTVGILEGSDPVLRNEYVVYSAHMDHVGVRQPIQGDSIYNGADDDASGTVSVVELAEAFAALTPRPKRSIIFLTVSGEEKGLWGSDFFTAQPPVPLGQLVANLNIDMIGRNWTDTVVVIGKEHSDLGRTLQRVASRHADLRMAPIDDIWPDERFYFRSDHYNFARRGVPILFFFTGTHEDYHRPSDHVEKIDVEKQSRIVKLLFYLGLEVANAAERPKWDPTSYAEIVEQGR